MKVLKNHSDFYALLWADLDEISDLPVAVISKSNKKNNFQLLLFKVCFGFCPLARMAETSLKSKNQDVVRQIKTINKLASALKRANLFIYKAEKNFNESVFVVY